MGDGSRISVWEEAWIRAKPPIRLSAPNDDKLKGLKVKDLLVPGQRVWNAPLIQALFGNEIAEKILTSPLVSMTEVDTMLWHPSSRGEYSVPSAYYLYLDTVSQA